MLNTRVMLFCSILIVLSCNRMLKAETDPYPNIHIPIVKNAYNIERFSNKPKMTKSANYYVKTVYPATKVLEFYDSKLTEMGFTESLRGEFGKRKWECFIDATTEGAPKVRQLLALWSNAEFNIEAALVMRYERTGEKWGDELHVLCQIQPSIDTMRLDSFLKKLEKAGQQASFLKLLDSYRMPNGEPDIDQAINENPNNDYLKEYKIIVDEIRVKTGGALK